ncbi:Enolase-like protein [Methanocaldococcus infernus ME]|uniref:Enolase-like protein n=1 Tax=Methanocaldococcus infernus (strain DSM 11812 / JCM 15783 / ME) TaxID=573063 RepID=D5VS06_METIM|nr:hypothetical protein [Methanocaldococcus infernus]ADG13359.1 Enolase-like protein [Methanocaldococcus infernus ME]
MIDVIIEQVNAKEVFKRGELKIMVSIITNLSVGYDIVKVKEPRDTIAEIENVVAPEIIGYSAKDIEVIDTILSELNLSSSITMPISVSVARAASNALDMPLFKFIGGSFISDLPTVACDILKDKENNSLFPIISAESIEEIVEFYLRIREELKNNYILAYDSYLCDNIFNEISKVSEIINKIKEDEDLEILLGLKAEKDKIEGKNLENIDFLETNEPLDFDGFLCTEGFYEESDFIKVNPYELGTISELSYYINYINEKELSPIISGENSSISHIAAGFKVPIVRTSIMSNILNELWNIERNIANPSITRF